MCPEDEQLIQQVVGAWEREHADRNGVFTWVMLEWQGEWLIRAAHNTNAGQPPK